MKSTPSITRLQVDWHRSSDLERARAVHTIKQSGVSIRKIAAELQVSESLLRHLLHALQAPSSDRVLAKQGEITTNELVRRAKAAGLRRDARVIAVTRTPFCIKDRVALQAGRSYSRRGKICSIEMSQNPVGELIGRSTMIIPVSRRKLMEVCNGA